MLGPLLERSVRRTLILPQGSLLVFMSRPVSLVLFLLAAVPFILSLHAGMGKSAFVLVQGGVRRCDLKV